MILKRDRFKCRVCGVGRRLVVHHRAERNEKTLLITLCIRCHVRLHRSGRLRYWVPEALLGLWRELHPAAPLQLQLPFAVTSDIPSKRQRRILCRIRLAAGLLTAGRKLVDEGASGHMAQGNGVRWTARRFPPHPGSPSATWKGGCAPTPTTRTGKSTTPLRSIAQRVQRCWTARREVARDAFVK
jgi:hypothetical protein